MCVCSMYVVIRSTLLRQDGDLPRRRVPLVSFVPFLFFLWINPCGAVFTHRVMPQHRIFGVIRVIQVMINLDHVKMEVIVVCVCMWRLVAVRGEVKDESALGPLGQKAQGTAA